MLLNTFYSHNMRYRTDPTTQFRENWLRSQKTRFWQRKCKKKHFFNFLKKYFWTCGLLQMLLNTLYFHYMRYRTDPMTQTREKWLRSQKVSFSDIFWRLIMLIMQKWDFSGTWGLLEMLLNNLYFHYMRYRTDPRTQFREKWPKSWQPPILALFWTKNGLKTFFLFP